MKITHFNHMTPDLINKLGKKSKIEPFANMAHQNKPSAGQLLDSLYLDMFHLIEEHTKCRINIERTHSSGAILLARTKYQQGGNSLSSAQIPTENSAECSALCRVVDTKKQEPTTLLNEEVSIERQAVNKENGFVDPINWFSVLPPISLRNAVVKFNNCIELVVESTNLQRELVLAMNYITKLRQYLNSQ